MKNKLDSLFFHTVFVPERHKYALLADANLKFASPRRETLRNEDNMIKNVIFDVGNVLVDFRPDDMMRDLGIPEEKIKPLAAATYASDIWIELDKGILAEEEIIQRMKEATPELAEEIELFFAMGKGELVMSFPYAASWLKSLQERGYKVYLLSNYSDAMFEMHSKTKFTFIPYIDGKVVSGHVKMIKPDAEIYEYLLSNFHLQPEECVFLDDRQDNVEAAGKLGIQTIQFLGYEDASQKLEEILKEQ